MVKDKIRYWYSVFVGAMVLASLYAIFGWPRTFKDDIEMFSTRAGRIEGFIVGVVVGVGASAICIVGTLL
ncbi:hypothetical protein M0R72_15245 [Candidatus Pacearchaeota archaeon]|nr:hypothetical protein [Candidatus Pacearchaeota archaeon]